MSSLHSLQSINASIPKPGALLQNDSAILSDPNLALEVFASGLTLPTNMAFLDSGEVLVLEKENGTVRKIVNGMPLSKPLLDLNVSTFDTRGMLGLVVVTNQTINKQYVFLYYTEAKDGKYDGQDKCTSPSKCMPDQTNGNRLSRYELPENGSKLINQKVIFSWPPFSGASHNGGEIVIGPDNNLYVLIGDGDNRHTIFSNSNESTAIDGRGGVLVFDQSGKSAFPQGIIGDKDPLNKYFAYGIRNGFGLDFDPITGKLWDTENGPGYGDEINMVEPGFNSGHTKILGFWKQFNRTYGELVMEPPINDLIDFWGKGKYSAPEFAWNQTIAPTAIKFLNSDKYGKKYENDLFVGTVKPNGDLYHFDLNPKRSELDLQGPLEDKIANNYGELSSVTFGKNFGVISDITVGPDGYLYIVSHTRGEIYRIIPIQQR
ncbi:MAG TPA: PQQ-dependent sugar dehydrogenase [Nitrososphaeraceae archaeon]|nr:PQQ-dependent sugar dehydrogenase [Nitrososphaeraceae archaeon]